MKTTSDSIVQHLMSVANPDFKKSMERAGINAQKGLGIKVTYLREVARKIGTDHELALQLWETGIHEALMLAAIVADPKQLTEKQMESWLSDFYSWDICDNAISSCFRKTPFAWDKINEWVNREAEFEKRAGFVMIAILAVHAKKEPDRIWLHYSPILKEGAKDSRNFVKKAVNWAIRQIGKRNLTLNAAMIEFCHELMQMDENSAHWIARDAKKELTSDALQTRLQHKK